MASKNQNFQKLVRDLYEAAATMGLATENPLLHAACQEMLETDLPKTYLSDPLNNQIILHLENSSARHLQQLLESEKPDRVADSIYTQIDERLCIEISFEDWLNQFQPKPASITNWQSQKRGGNIWDITQIDNIHNIVKSWPQQIAVSEKPYPYGLEIYVEAPTQEQWQTWQQDTLKV